MEREVAEYDPGLPIFGVGLKYWHLIAAGAAMLVCLAIIWGSWVAFQRPKVLSYGGPSQTYFLPERVTEGDTTDLCFEGAVWHEICPSILSTWLIPAKGPRLDLDSRELDNPPEAQPVPLKCRKWKVPELGAHRTAGWAIVTGRVKSRCNLLDLKYPIYTQFPSVKIYISKRTP